MNILKRLFGSSNSIPDDPVDRNNAGIAAEKAGDVERAILLYEMNVDAHHDAPHPYERLRIIYTKQKRYSDALRVVRAYLPLAVEGGGVLAAKTQWRAHEAKLIALIAKS